MSKVLPILFNSEMVQAILKGRKTVTRRVIKPQPILDGRFWKIGGAVWSNNITSLRPMIAHSLYDRMSCHVGDILYVRETWNINNLFSEDDEEFYTIFEYKADGAYNTVKISEEVYEKYEESMAENMPEWRPSIHMPKEAARIFLRVTDVRVERLKDMTLDNFLAEGVILRPEAFNDPENAYWQARKIFSGIWDSAIPKKDMDKHGFDANPWVWVIEFERCEKPEEDV